MYHMYLVPRPRPAFRRLQRAWERGYMYLSLAITTGCPTHLPSHLLPPSSSPPLLLSLPFLSPSPSFLPPSLSYLASWLSLTNSNANCGMLSATVLAPVALALSCIPRRAGSSMSGDSPYPRSLVPRTTQNKT